MGANTIPTKDAAGNIVTLQSPFAAKGNTHFRGTGVKKTIASGATDNIDLVVPYAIVKYNGIEVLNGDYDDVLQLKIIDDASGTYSTVPNYVLDQFGIDWNMSKEFRQQLPYDATLYTGMIIRVVYTNNTAASKTIYVNHYLHEEVV